MAAKPVHYGSQIQERCHVGQRPGSIVLGGLDWAGGRICGIIYEDGPGEGQTEQGPGPAARRPSAAPRRQRVGSVTQGNRRETFSRILLMVSIRYYPSGSYRREA
jgi:hypothetical protein